jgi:hypothetical protein
MAVRTRANFKSTKNSRFTTNGTGAITGVTSNDMFEDAADSFVMFEDLGSTSGSDIIKHVKATIPSASILTAFTTPVTLISAQGSGTMIEVVSLSGFYDYNSVAYATNTTIDFGYTGATSLTSLGGILNSTNDKYFTWNLSFSTISQDISNKSFVFSVQTGNPTAGNSPLYLYLTYRVITL